MRLLLVVLALACATCLLGAAAASAADQIYWGTASAVRFAPLSGGSGATLFSDSNFPTGEAIDVAAGKIYWTHNDVSTITVGNLDGSGTPQDLFSSEGRPIGNMGIDVATGKLYWTDFGSGLIRVGNLSGTGTPQTLFSGEGGPLGVAIDPAPGKMYWADFNSGLIREGNLDGTGTPQTLFSGQTSAYGVAIDTAAGKIYWVVQTGQVRVGNLNGTGTAQTLFTGEGVDSGLALDPSAGKLYWGNQSDAIRVGNVDGTGAQTLVGGESHPVSPVLLRAPLGAGTPTISGATVPGSTLICSQGSWAPDLVGAFLYRVPRSFSYSWQLNGTSITGTTSSITASSAGSYTCTVTASNQAGSAHQTSAAFSVSTPNACQDQTGAYNAGFDAGFNSGFRRGFNAGYRVGSQRGLGSHSLAATPTYPACNAEFNQGFQTAFNKGFKSGFRSGFKSGFNAKHRHS